MALNPSNSSNLEQLALKGLTVRTKDILGAYPGIAADSDMTIRWSTAYYVEHAHKTLVSMILSSCALQVDVIVRVIQHVFSCKRCSHEYARYATYCRCYSLLLFLSLTMCCDVMLVVFSEEIVALFNCFISSLQPFGYHSLTKCVSARVGWVIAYQHVLAVTVLSSLTVYPWRF